MRSVVESYRGKSVRVFRFDREGCLERLRERALRILEAEPDVLEVRLFGSIARGDCRPGSDADILVTLRATDEPFLDRATRFHRHLEGVGVGCDILVYTEDEMARLRAERSGIVRAADAEGVRLARR